MPDAELPRLGVVRAGREQPGGDQRQLALVTPIVPVVPRLETGAVAQAEGVLIVSAKTEAGGERQRGPAGGAEEGAAVHI